MHKLSMDYLTLFYQFETVLIRTDDIYERFDTDTITDEIIEQLYKENEPDIVYDTSPDMMDLAKERRE